ncbi:MAG TPA: uroporphyrinogen decarboxylase family protein [Armatimonadota bacterium]|jgi:uroporphyrinogen decarboxylase
MTDRERFLRYMNYEPVDRPPLHLTGPWGDTLERWYGEGLPRDVDYNEYLGLAVKPLQINNISGQTGLWPLHEYELLREEGDFKYFRDSYGRTVRDFREHTSMPEWIDFPVKNGADLQRVLDEHFDLSDMDARYGPEWEAKVRQAADGEGVILIDGGCYYWNLRSMAGVEVTSYLFYDAYDLIDELFERINQVCLEGIRRASEIVQIEVIGYGEDLAYKNGPLLSPPMFRKLILPRYKKVMDLAHEKGVTLTWYDSDGDVRLLIPDYLSVGINCPVPCEVAAGMSAPELRRDFGRDLRLVGAIDKREIAKGHAAIDAEIERNRPVIEDGGFLPAIDHSIPADVSLDNYRYFLDKIQQAVGVV